MSPLTLPAPLRTRIRVGSRTYQRLMREAKAEYDASFPVHSIRVLGGLYLRRRDGSARRVRVALVPMPRAA